MSVLSNFQTQIDCLHSVQSLTIVNFEGVIHSVLGRPPVPLVHLPELLHLVIDCVASLTVHIQPCELESTEKVLLDTDKLDSLVGLDNSLNVAPAAAQHVVLLHVPANISK